MSQEAPSWKEFEKAVESFLLAFGSKAKITHDARLPDAHTGLARQRDIWIESTLLEHFPVKALISCKLYGRPLNQQDIDHFNGEFISSNAQVGVIYANTFNDAALAKAKALSFSCCRLYSNEPANIPGLLNIPISYLAYPVFSINLLRRPSSFVPSNWRDVFAADSSNSLEHTITKFIDDYQEFDGRWNRMRAGFGVDITVPSKPPEEIAVQFLIKDRVYQSKHEFNLLNGSYNITADKFLGSQTTPWIDTQGKHPGPGWEEAVTLPEKPPPKHAMMYFTMSPQNVIDLLSQAEIVLTPPNS